MTQLITKVSLSGPRRRLLELLQRLHFGRIEGLVVRAGQSVFEPPPRVTREHKFGGDNGPHPDLNSPHAALKAQQVELLRTLDQIGDGIIDGLEVKHGVPFRMLLGEAP